MNDSNRNIKLTILNLSRKAASKSLRKCREVIYSFIPPNKQMGKEYWQLKELINTAQWWDRDRIEQWQLKKLQEMVCYAYENVPGYNALYRDAGVKPEDIVSLDDIQRLPFTSKELLRENINDFTSRIVPVRKLRYNTTGGSTGIPLGFYQTVNNYWVENAFMHSGWERVGWKLGEVSAVLRGSYAGSSQKIGRYDKAKRELHLSSYYLNDSSYAQYIQLLEKYSPKYLRAYPSAVALFSDMIRKHNDIGKLNFSAIFLGSENIYEWQIEKLKQVFPETKLFGWYGHTEQAVLAPMCEYSNYYHVWPFYGYAEVVDEKGSRVGQGASGELVGTSFWGYGTPFIRYRTADIVQRGASYCDKCNRQFDIIERVEGRSQDYVVTSDGNYVTLTALIFAQHFHAFGSVKNMQLYQDKTGEVIVRIVPTATFSDHDKVEIKRKMETAVDGGLYVTIVIVDEIKLTERGKYRFLDQKLNINMGN